MCVICSSTSCVREHGVASLFVEEKLRLFGVYFQLFDEAGKDWEARKFLPWVS